MLQPEEAPDQIRGFPPSPFPAKSPWTSLGFLLPLLEEEEMKERQHERNKFSFLRR